MPVTHQIIGTGITKRVQPTLSLSSIQQSDGRIILNVGEPCSEEDVAAFTASMKNIEQNSTFEGITVPWVDFCQNVLAKANLPPWDKDVRIYANGDWADDLPEDWFDRAHEILRPGEGIGRAKNAAELKHGIDSQESFAAEILQKTALVRTLIARGATRSVAHFALELGILMTTATFKFTYEPKIMRHEESLEYLRNATKESAQVRGRKMQTKRENVRKEADRLWKDHPDWRISDVLLNINNSKKFPDLKENTIRGYLKSPAEWSTTYKPRK